MSTQAEVLTKMLDAAPLDKRIEFAKMIRTELVRRVGATERVLDPKELREIDAGIAMLEAQRN